MSGEQDSRLAERNIPGMMNRRERFAEPEHGDVMSRMTNDIENISTTVSQSLPSLFSGVLTVIGTMAVMLWYCWQLALLSFVTVLLTFLATKFLSGRVRRFSRKRRRCGGTAYGRGGDEPVPGYDRASPTGV